MTLLEMKKKVLGLIEELNPENEALTDDPDIKTKINGVINQVLYEMARCKKIPGYVEIEVKQGDLLVYDDIESESGYEVYQINTVKGVEYEYKANGTMIKIMEDGVAEIEFFRYPERITEKTKNNYEFELSPDALEIMPYGIAGDLLKSDVSAEYGRIYSERYEYMKQQLDPRYNLTSITIEGGVNI